MKNVLFSLVVYTTKRMDASVLRRRQRQIDRYTGFIIHIFAAAHAATAIITRLLDYDDDIPLTVLTISMLILIAIRRRLSLSYTAITTLLVTLVGYLAGVWIGQVLDSAIGSPLAASAIATFLLTELFGWGIYLTTSKIKIDGDNYEDTHTVTRQIIIAALLILFVRVTYSLIFRSPHFIAQGGIYAIFGELFSNTFATLTLSSFIVVLTVLPRRNTRAAGQRRLHRSIRDMLTLAAIVLFPLLPALIAYYDFPQSEYDATGEAFDRYAFGGLYAVALLATIIAYPAAILVKYALVSGQTIRTERSKKLSEQYKYAKLKQQISPHFLFNSLSILDSLVQNGENERAGVYIRKLAALYRYVLKNEEEPLVTLGEEMEFTNMYIDLLKVRFADGLFINNRLDDSDSKRHIVPCGLQMLIENAIKHNIVGAESPLNVVIEVEGDFIAVANNLQPRISTQPSTRLSLKNLSRQYENIAGARIEVLQTDAEFRVRLPLL